MNLSIQRHLEQTLIHCLEQFICSFTRSRPVTSSVTGCSTWSLVFTSKKKNSFVLSSNKNSTVPADSYLSAEAS